MLIELNPFETGKISMRKKIAKFFKILYIVIFIYWIIFLLTGFYEIKSLNIINDVNEAIGGYLGMYLAFGWIVIYELNSNTVISQITYNAIAKYIANNFAYKCYHFNYPFLKLSNILNKDLSFIEIDAFKKNDSVDQLDAQLLYDVFSIINIKIYLIIVNFIWQIEDGFFSVVNYDTADKKTCYLSISLNINSSLSQNFIIQKENIIGGTEYDDIDIDDKELNLLFRFTPLNNDFSKNIVIHDVHTIGSARIKEFFNNNGIAIISNKGSLNWVSRLPSENLPRISYFNKDLRITKDTLEVADSIFKKNLKNFEEFIEKSYIPKIK